MSKVFTIADLHLGHEKAALARGFPNTIQHDDAIISAWNSVVGKRDSVFVLGDVVFGQDNFKLLSYLNGTKKLVLGNHDKYPIHKYMRYFSQIYGCVKYKDYILSHVPVHENQMKRFKGNIHGHLHSKVVVQKVTTTFNPRLQLEKAPDGRYYKEVPDTRYKCVSAEQINLTPIAFEELI